MVEPSKHLEIASMFQRSLKTGSTSEIDQIPLDDLRLAKYNLLCDQNSAYYPLLVETLKQREASHTSSPPSHGTNEYIQPDKIEAMRSIPCSDYDLQKLIRLCEEVNFAWNSRCYFTTAILVRAIVDHVPPIFGCSKFSEVANNYAGSFSFKKLIGEFEKTLRPLADGYMHEQIRKHEAVPDANSVHFVQPLDKLLEEIIRLLK